MNRLFENGEHVELPAGQMLVVAPQADKIFLRDGDCTVVLFSDIEPPRIKCPSVKERIAEPNKLTVRVSWETPEGRDTADGILTE